MASFVETTAVSLRKGDTVSNLNFTGVLGELVADLGYEEAGTLGVDGNATIRLHNSVTKGGIPMCRADTRNITTQVLAENRGLFDDKNLAYADLSNIENTEDAEARNTIVETLSEYGMVNSDVLQEEVSKLALKDMSNVITSTLATGRGRGENGNLAYADTSNINTADLVSTSLHYGQEEGDWPLAYADVSNIDTTNLTLEVADRPNTMEGPVLATNTFSNITKETWQDNLFDTANELYLEQTTNKDYEIPENHDEVMGDHYPTTNAVINHVRKEIDNGNFLKSDFSNATDYSVLTDNTKVGYEYKVIEIINGGSGFTADRDFFTGKVLSADKQEYLKILIQENIPETPDDEEISIKLIPDIGKTDLTAITELNIKQDDLDVTIAFKCTFDEKSNVYLYTCTSDEDNAEPLFVERGEGHLKDHIGKTFFPAENLKVNPVLAINVNIDENGQILSCRPIPERGKTFFEEETVSIISPAENGTNASIKISCEAYIPSIGGAGLAKTDLSNLLGMDEKDNTLESSSPWRIRHEEQIPSIKLNEISDSEYYNISNNGKVWEAIKETKTYMEQLGGVPDWKPGNEYITSPSVSKVFYNGDIYWCKTPHTATDTFDPSKWEKVSLNTYELRANKNQDISLYPTDTIKYPTNKAVADYVKEQIDAVHIPGHYQGQVNIMVPTEGDLNNLVPGITNCLTEIPDDIKLEITDSAVVIKAGSKVYVPNGFKEDGITPDFNTLVFPTDYNVPHETLTGQYMLGMTGLQVQYRTPPEQCYSGIEAPENPVNLAIWYDTTNNVIKRYYNNVGWSVSSGYSLPIAILNYTETGKAPTITQVFNGLGYIGSTVFATPGIKGLIPNGKNNGLLNTIPVILDKVYTRNIEDNVTSNTDIRVYTDHIGAGLLTYNSEQNLNYSTVDQVVHYCFNAGKLDIVDSRIISLTPVPVTPLPEYTIAPYEGMTALVENYSVISKPAIATYTNNAWTFEAIVLQNGVYVYVLNLGTSYLNGPGNATWNGDTNKFDIAPDQFQVPDGKTLNLNESTGAIQIIPRLQTQLAYLDVNNSIQDTMDDIYSRLDKLDNGLAAMIIPAPQFFNATNTIGQTLVLTDNVAFDLYVNGLFQYPNTYEYNPSTKTITLNFAAENTQQNGIAVVYRGFRTL